MAQLLWKTVWGFLKNTKNRTTLWSSNSTAGFVSEEIQNTNSKRYLYPCVYCSVIYHSKNMKATQVPINRQMEKEDAVHMYGGILLNLKEEQNLTICNNSMDGPRGHCAKWNKSLRERQIPNDFTFMWNLMNKINEPTNRNRLRYREETEGCLMREDWVVWVKKVKGLRSTNW